MSIGDNIKRLRTSNNLSQIELGKIAGVTDKAVSTWENGEKIPRMGAIERMAQHFGITKSAIIEDTPIDFLHLIDSEKNTAFAFSAEEKEHIKKYRVLDIYNKRLVDDVLDAAYNNMTRDINPEEHGMAYLNCYELPAAAGTGEPLGDTYYTDKIQIPLNRVPENAHICIRVHGDSMEPAYHDGDIVMVERFDSDTVREGEIGIFVLNGDGYIKRLGNRELVSLNPAYDPIPIHDYDDLRCMGRVLGKV